MKKKEVKLNRGIVVRATKGLDPKFLLIPMFLANRMKEKGLITIKGFKGRFTKKWLDPSPKGKETSVERKTNQN